jgi:hypothetical protein
MKYLIATASFITLTSPAFADGFPQAFADIASESTTAIARSDRNGDGELSVGEAMAGWFHGNTANPSGQGNGVLPSISPGPDLANRDRDGDGIIDDGFGTVGANANNDKGADPAIDPEQGFE